MSIESLPSLLLNGNYFHCRPTEAGPTVEAQIIPSKDESSPTLRVVIVCPARLAASKCDLRVRTGSGDKHCLWYRGDSKGEYQIIGPDAYKKSDRGWE